MSTSKITLLMEAAKLNLGVRSTPYVERYLIDTRSPFTTIYVDADADTIVRRTDTMRHGHPLTSTVTITEAHALRLMRDDLYGRMEN